MASGALAGCATAAPVGTSYLGAALPEPCLARDVEACVGWMVERDLADAELALYDDGALRDYVQGVAERLARGSSLGDVPRVVIADREGSYATSGSRIVIGRPTIARLGSEAELAGVVAHELAHLEGHHSQVSLFGPPDDDRLALQRDVEAVADERAVALLARAGYAPSAMARALAAVLDGEDDEHPPRAERIARAAALAEALVSAQASIGAAIETAAGAIAAAGAAGAGGGRPAGGGFEGRAELLARLDGMIVGRDARRGQRVGDAWVVAALEVALDLGPGDVVREADDVLVVRRDRATLAAYAVGAPWGHELAAQLVDQASSVRPLGRITVGTMAAAARADTPLGRLAGAIRSTLPQPAVGAHVAIVERPRGALVIELGQLGDGTAPGDHSSPGDRGSPGDRSSPGGGDSISELGSLVPRDALAASGLGLRPATPAERSASAPARIAVERAWRRGTVAQQLLCTDRLLDDPERHVEPGDPIKCADRVVSN